MNAHAETDKCRYCQIDLVDIQQLTAPATQLTRVENKQLTSSVMKCPVCGYSKLGKPSLVKNHIGPEFAIVDRHSHTA